MARLGTIDRQNIGAGVAPIDRALNPLRPLSTAVEHIFTSDQEQTRIQKVRSIMGDLVTPLADEEIEACMTELQYLIDEWLDEFERQAFDGDTLRQALNQE